MAVTDIGTSELEKIIKKERENLEIIDVREPQEYDIVRFKDSKLISLEGIMNDDSEINWNKKVVLVCRTGSRSAFVADLLSRKGKDVINLENGLYDYYRKGDRDDLEIDEDMIKMYF